MGRGVWDIGTNVSKTMKSMEWIEGEVKRGLTDWTKAKGVDGCEVSVKPTPPNLTKDHNGSWQRRGSYSQRMDA